MWIVTYTSKYLYTIICIGMKDQVAFPWDNIWNWIFKNTTFSKIHEKKPCYWATSFFIHYHDFQNKEELPLLLTSTPLEINQATILQAAKEDDVIGNWWWRLTVRKHTQRKDLSLLVEHSFVKKADLWWVHGQPWLRWWQFADSATASLGVLPQQLFLPASS